MVEPPQFSPAETPPADAASSSATGENPQVLTRTRIHRRIEIDIEVADAIAWLAEQQGLSPELALKKAVATAAYIQDITQKQGGQLLVRRRDNTVGEIVFKSL